MVIGPPSDEQGRRFEHMLALQCPPSTRSGRAPRQGRPHRPWLLRAARPVGAFAPSRRPRDRPSYHEAPLLGRGHATKICPGMVCTVEPELYAAAPGGIRRNDTVVVTNDGLDFLTSFRETSRA
jgi:Metallopeptidase family M24